MLKALLQDHFLDAAGNPSAADFPVSPLLSKLRFLVLKNLAALLSREGAAGDESAQRGLELYCQALAMEDDSVMLWQQMGTLVSDLALRLSLASKAGGAYRQ